MNRDVFNVQMAALANAFINSTDRITPETVEIYWEELKGIPEHLFLKAVHVCLAECRFFPAIAEIGDRAIGNHLADYNPRSGSREINWRETLEAAKVGDLKRRMISGPAVVALLREFKPAFDGPVRKLIE